MTATLELRPFGRTNEQVTVIGLGGGYLDKHSLADGIATVHRALDRGINYFDTAPVYGQGASQVILGNALEGRTEPHLLATKIGFLAQSEAYRSPDALRSQLWESLRALRRSHVDILQIHLAESACWWKSVSCYQKVIFMKPLKSILFAAILVFTVLGCVNDNGGVDESGPEVYLIKDPADEDAFYIQLNERPLTDIVILVGIKCHDKTTETTPVLLKAGTVQSPSIRVLSTGSDDVFAYSNTLGHPDYDEGFCTITIRPAEERNNLPPTHVYKGSLKVSSHYPFQPYTVGEPSEQTFTFAIDVFIPDSHLREAIRRAVDRDLITPAAMAELTELPPETDNFNSTRLENVSDLTGLEHATNLRSLDLNPAWRKPNSNSVSDLSPLVGLTNLESLDLSGNSISDISALANLTRLNRLDLANNTISDISALANLTNLSGFLFLSNNNITDFSVLANLSNLSSLGLSGNSISDISVLAGLTNLDGLFLRDNNITDISALANLTRLNRLNLANNTISDISALANLPNLSAFLILSNNNITDISVLANLTNLGGLDLLGNNITDISVLANLTRLHGLDLSGNDITNISALANLTRLWRLHLSNNNITDISVLANLTNLDELHLSGNNITDISVLVGLPRLQYLVLEGNPLNDTSIHTHIPALQRRGVRIEK